MLTPEIHRQYLAPFPDADGRGRVLWTPGRWPAPCSDRVRTSIRSGAGARRFQAISGAVAEIEKQYGKIALMRLGDNGAPAQVPVVPTGSLGREAKLELGTGGLLRGPIVELYGPASSGVVR